MNYTQQALEQLQGKTKSIEMSISMASKRMGSAVSTSEIVEVANEITRLNKDLQEYKSEIVAYQKGLDFQTFTEKADKYLTPEQEAERDEILEEQELILKAERFYGECVENGWYTN
ncbi:hypothetical protein [Staphylococcus aureus]|uniref:hypothetical protein n=1 Tax=Staphylococcus aureus TaxID=1280 RepID=UPI0020C035FF|nr:hypothetical protein [Staphylococcus aureus]